MDSPLSTSILLGLLCCLVCVTAINVTETRNVSGFTGLQSSGPFVVTVDLTGSEGVQIDADLDDTNVTKSLLTYVKDGVLVLRFAWPYDVDVGAFTNRIHISVSAIAINNIELSGSGTIFVNSVLTSPQTISAVSSGSGNISLPVKTGDVSVVLAGSGNIVVSGSTGNLNAVISGSGGLGGNNLAANSVSMSVYGTGNAVINAKNTLSVVMMGSGLVKYHGDPTVNVINMGSGFVLKIA